MTELRRPTPLDTKRHDRAGFQSGDPTLDEWLRRYAGQNRRADTAATWVTCPDPYLLTSEIEATLTGGPA